jgi:hypothetical protein
MLRNMKIDYNGHTIESVATELPPDEIWCAKVIVSWSQERTEVRQFDGPVTGFRGKGEAEAWGIEFGKKWIDDGKPSLR